MLSLSLIELVTVRLLDVRDVLVVDEYNEMSVDDHGIVELVTIEDMFVAVGKRGGIEAENE